ncbi:hypothetical protein HY605_02565 [Candidatus Peregrinibacteria bacterium]|nr:hypothetical protein [Candidatus Peregrinibacteria bacterium]
MTMIVGKVESGRGLGRELGFPTLNIAYAGALRGVYVAKVLIDGVWFKAAVNIGARPTICDEEVLCEVSVIDWAGEAPSGELFVKLFKKIREIEKFPNLKLLSERIAKDTEFVKLFPC